MTVRNPLVRIGGKIVELPSGDALGGAAQGPVGITWQGTWSSLTAYVIDDAVEYNGSSYIAIQDGTNQTPDPAGTAYWELIASKGDTGATGATGNTGAAGASPQHTISGRLTLTSGTPVTTSDVTGATTIYWTPYRGAQISLYNGSTWGVISFSETSKALGTLTSGANYDVFAYDNSGALALEFSSAWTSDTARNDALALQDGIYVKSADHTRRYLGTFRTTSTTATEDSAGGTSSSVGGKRFVWNYHNRVRRNIAVIDTTATWSYTTATTRQARANSGNQVEIVCGMPEDLIDGILVAAANISGSGATFPIAGIGVNSTTAFSGLVAAAFSNSGSQSMTFTVPYRGYPRLGYSYFAWLEQGKTGTTFLGGGSYQTGMQFVYYG